jgi:hypothetical protein
MCSRGKHFSWVNLGQYYRCYGKNTDISTTIPVKFMSSRHIFHIFGSYCAFNVGIEFPIDHMHAHLACVLQAKRDMLHKVRVCSKVNKNRYFFKRSVKVNTKINIRVFVLKEKWGRIENTAPLRPIMRQSMYKAPRSTHNEEYNRKSY